MSPKLRQENYISVIPERIREVARKNNVKMKDLAAAVSTVYENFARQVKKGNIQRAWLEIICDMLDVSSDYITGKSDFEATRLAERRLKTDGKKAIADFMISRGFTEDFTKELTTDDYDNIEMLIYFICTERMNPIQLWADNLTSLLNQLKERTEKDGKQKS